MTGDRARVWVVDLDAPALDDGWARARLGQDEAARADRFVHDRIRHRWLVARASLRTLLGRAIGASPNSLEFTYGEHGKPRLVGEALAFNVSHSAGVAVVAIADGAAIGVDVELPRASVDIDGVGARVFQEDELNVMRASSDPRASFFRLWTLKESYMKGVGAGFSLEPSSFAFAGFARENEPILLRSAQRPHDVGAWGFRTMVVDGAPISVARPRTDGWTIDVERVEPASLLTGA